MNLGNEDKHNRDQVAYYSSEIKARLIHKETPYIQRQINEVIEAGQITNEDKVLEVGCGMGRITLHLAKRGLQISGLELTPFLIEELKKRNNNAYDIPLYCSDITDYPKELNETFDVIVGFFVLHHFHDLKKSFIAMNKMLKPGGRIIFLEPNAYNPLYYLQVTLTPGMSWKADKGIINMTRSKLFRSMKNAEFSDLSLKRYGFFPPFISNRKLGSKLENILEKVTVFKPILPFQIFTAKKIS